MQGISSWSFKPYHPPLFDKNKIYISRVAPYKTEITIEWFDNLQLGEYIVNWKRLSDTNYKSFKTKGNMCKLNNLDKNTDYSFYITSGNFKSAERLARTGYVPGIVVNYLHPDDKYYEFSGNYLCSPSILKHPEGFLLASMDVYASKKPQNLTLIMRSDDNGKTWYHLTELFPCFWGKLFIHNNDIYMLGMSTEYGDLLIGKSVDGGRNFSTPTVIVRGSCSGCEFGFHKAPMPIVKYKGRLWTGIDYGAWSKGGHASMLASVDVKSDLLNATNWTLTEPVSYNPNWPGTVKGKSKGCLEGNAVVSKSGQIYNILRYQTDGCSPSYGKAMVLKGDACNPEKALEFEKVIDFPGNMSKFDILYDDISDKYYSILSSIKDESCIKNRNLLSLAVSDNLDDWTVVSDLLDFSKEDPKKIGFQYVSFEIDGDDIIYLCRTALNNAHNFHDANYSTFHRISNFRRLVK